MFHWAQLFEGLSALNPGFFFFWIIFSLIFKSVQSSTCWQNDAGSRFRFSPGACKFPLYRANIVSPPSKLKMFTGSVCVLLTSVSLKLITIKLIYATTSSWEKNKMPGERKLTPTDFIVLFMIRVDFFMIRVDPSPILFYFYFFYSIQVDPSWSGPTFVPA